MAPNGPGGFFPTNPDLADILGDMDFDFENLYFSDFSGSQISGLGPAWAQLGPSLDPAWARLGPSLYPACDIGTWSSQSRIHNYHVGISRKKTLLASKQQ